MLVIRLQRIGKKHQPSYRVVVSERRSNMAGPPVEDLGAYSVATKKASIRTDRVQYWIGMGARPSDTVHNLFVKEGIVSGKKIAVHKKKKKIEGVEAEKKEEVPVAAAQ